MLCCELVGLIITALVRPDGKPPPPSSSFSFFHSPLPSIPARAPYLYAKQAYVSCVRSRLRSRREEENSVSLACKEKRDIFRSLSPPPFPIRWQDTLVRGRAAAVFNSYKLLCTNFHLLPCLNFFSLISYFFRLANCWRCH